METATRPVAIQLQIGIITAATSPAIPGRRPYNVKKHVRGPLCDMQQDTRRTFRGAAALLPIPQGGEADS